MPTRHVRLDHRSPDNQGGTTGLDPSPGGPRSRAPGDRDPSAIGRFPFSGSAVMGVIDRVPRRALALLICVASSSLVEPAEAAEPTPVWVGTGSCSATSCHKGRREPLDLKGSEYEFSGAY